MTRLAFTVLVGPWWAGEDGPYSDAVEIDDASPTLVRLASHAHAAGVLSVAEGLDLSDVEPQEASETAYAAAQASGDWQEGNELQHALETAEEGS